MDKIFDACVAMLLDMAAFTGTTYKTINVIIFCIIWPIATLVLVLLTLRQRDVIKDLKKRINK